MLAMRNHTPLVVSALLLGACAAQPTDVSRGVPSVSAPALQQPLPDIAPPLAQRPVPQPGAEPTYLGTRLMEMMVYFLSGTFDTIPQAPTDGDSTPVRLHVKPLWTERKGEFWLYFEYAIQADLTHPFRQRVLRFREAGGDIYADEFLLDDPARWVGEWSKPQPFAALDPSGLREQPGCRMLFVKQMEAVFAGGSATDKCPGSVPGSYERSEYNITSASIRSWVRSFDPSRRQVAGPGGPWEFRKIAR